MNNSVALQEHDSGGTFKFEVQTLLEDESRQKLCGHMMLQECARLEYIISKLEAQEVEDMLLEFERQEAEEQSANGTETSVLAEDAD